MDSNDIFSSGLKYIENYLNYEEANKLDIKKLLGTDSIQYEMLSFSMMALCQMSTCYPKCRGTDHRIEAIVGRAHNCCTAALLLTSNGYYDEALNLIRSAAEISNLLMMFKSLDGSYNKWVKSSRAERINKFSPGKVRNVLDNHKIPIIIDQKMYRELCETATHITPSTRPNAHDSENQGFVGCSYQKKGYKKCIDNIEFVSCAVALPAAGLLERRDLGDELYIILDKIIKYHMKNKN